MGGKKSDPANWRQSTRLVRGGTERSAFGETSEGLFLTSGYVYESAEEAEQAFKGEKQRYMYSRYANPTVTMFEKRLALLEGAETCVSTAPGMAAVFAALASQLKAGDRVVSSRALFGSCLYIIAEQLPKFGIETVLVDGIDLEEWKAALSTETQCVFLETPSNPVLEIIDTQTVSDLAHEAGAKIIVDNVFATPILQRPLELGADIVMYSATKHIDGQGRTLGGAILTNDTDFIENDLTPFFRHTGPSLSPFNAWVFLKGLETLSLRMSAQSARTLELAQWLETQPGIARVHYAGLPNHPQHALAAKQQSAFGAVMSIEVEDAAGNRDRQAAWRFIDATRLISITANLGDVKTTVTHPATTTHGRVSEEEKQRAGVTENLIRLAIGLESVADLKADLSRGLKALAV